MKPAVLLRERLARHDLITGVIASFHLWPDLVRICRDAGLDYLIVDMEHGSFSLELIAQVCTTGRHLDFPVLVRPHANDFDTIRLVLDQGPVGLLVAYIQDPSELDVVRDAVYMPPRGRRRPGGVGNFWVPDYHYATWKREVEDQFLVLPQIETQRGVQNVAAIAAHEITTALAIGPYDLSADLGICGEMDHALLTSTLDTIRAAGRAAGKETWMIGGDSPLLARNGWRFLCLGEPTFVLQGALKDRLVQTQKAAGGAAGAASS
jgi:2-keto-3-deoxy-L-rhamnonate aldolase RhmA